MSASNPISPKVVAGTIGGGAGLVVANLLIWIIGASVFNGGWSADHVDNAIAAVPAPLYALIVLLVTLAGVYFPAYQTTDPLRTPTLGQDRGTGV